MAIDDCNICATAGTRPGTCDHCITTGRHEMAERSLPATFWFEFHSGPGLMSRWFGDGRPRLNLMKMLFA